MSGLTARSGPRTLIGLLAALGLVGALTMPVLATHVEPELVEGASNKTCGELGEYAFEFKVDEENPSGFYDEDDSDVVVSSATDFEVTITPGANNTISFTANLAVEAVYVKGGPIGGNLYEYNPTVLSDSGLHTPGNHGISHVSFCFGNEPSETPAPTEEPTEAPTEEPTEAPTEEPTEAPTEEPTEAPTEEPTEAPTEEPTEAPTATPREGELGGNPTATPSGGTLPDTAMGEWSQVPATVLSLILLGSLGGMLYVRLARQR